MDRSMSGAEVAASAASSARFFPLDTPTPSIAVPLLLMMAFTSAKSTFTRPGIWEEVNRASVEGPVRRA
jgi:hypothetical protein